MKKTRNLTLAQALEFSRPIKRFMDFHWREVNEGTIAVTPDDISATDWEVKPEPIRLKVYLSPDRTKISLDPGSPFDWDALSMIEEGKS